MARDIARGTLAKVIIVTVMAVVGIVGSTYLEPWTQEYEVKTAINLTCADVMRVRVEGTELPEDVVGPWNTRLNRTGAKPKPGGVKWKFVNTPKSLRCEGTVVYDTATEWNVISVIKPDTPRWKIHHVVKVVKEVDARW